MTEPRFTVYDHQQQVIGNANTIGEAKKLHEEHYNGTEHGEQYAGLDGSMLPLGIAAPLFCSDYY